MKLITLFTFVVYSSFSFAGLICNNKDSGLMIRYISNTKVVVTFNNSGNLAESLVFESTDHTTGGNGYYVVNQFKLKGDAGEAELSISSSPIITRNPQNNPPACRLRSCGSNKSAVAREEIASEFTFEGKTHYAYCSKH